MTSPSTATTVAYSPEVVMTSAPGPSAACVVTASRWRAPGPHEHQHEKQKAATSSTVPSGDRCCPRVQDLLVGREGPTTGSPWNGTRTLLGHGRA